MRHLICCMSAVALLVSAPALAETVVDNSVMTGGIGYLGESPRDSVIDVYWAQTFTTPSTESQLRSLQFRILNDALFSRPTVPGNGDLSLRVLVTEFTTHPTSILYESAHQTVARTDNTATHERPMKTLDFEMPDVHLQPETQYAFVLDTFTDANLADEIYPHAIMDVSSGYHGGSFFAFIVPLDQNDQPIGTRADHFAAAWREPFGSANIDLAFKLVFVPEPAAVTLTAIALAALFISPGMSRRLRSPSVHRRSLPHSSARD